MISRIEVSFKKDDADALGNSVKKRILENLNMNVDSVRTVDVYTIDSDCSLEELKKVGKVLFTDPMIQEFTVDSSLMKDFNWLIEVGYKPGVTDNVGRTSREAIEEILKRKINENI